ncbi:MAG: hypothetical protein IJ815_07555, partial [Lachnospiraceae bacterium]|nr:hypothetical protein [Lachnospiraceae bacterium]
EIEELQNRSEELDGLIVKSATDFVKLNELTKEKEDVDKRLEEKIERYLELEEMVESFKDL